MRKRLFIALILILVGVTSSSWAVSGKLGNKLGDTAPPLDVVFVKGDSVDLEEVRGKKIVIVEFWATWCAPCRESIPHLTKLQKKYGGMGLVIVGISDETRDEVVPYVKEMGAKMDYTIAADPTNTTTNSYRNGIDAGIPHAFLINENGVIVWHGHPMDPRMEELAKELVEELHE